MSEEIFQNRLIDKQLIVFLDFEDRVRVDDAQELFELFRGQELECTEHTLSFGAMYAVELSDILVKLDSIFSDYNIRFGLVQNGNALKITMEFA